MCRKTRDVRADWRILRRRPPSAGAYYNADGRLIMVHEKRVVSDTAYDIHVKDAAGKLKGVIHHSDVDRGEPFTISEEWPE